MSCDLVSISSWEIKDTLITLRQIHFDFSIGDLQTNVLWKNIPNTLPDMRSQIRSLSKPCAVGQWWRERLDLGWVEGIFLFNFVWVEIRMRGKVVGRKPCGVVFGWCRIVLLLSVNRLYGDSFLSVDSAVTWLHTWSFPIQLVAIE